MEHKQFGAIGERIAESHIREMGYLILERNYRWGKGEIDLIVQKENTLVICEVKARQSSFFGSPCHAVTKAKQRQLIKVANRYIEDKKLDMEIRFDVIGVITNLHETQIEHIENAFIPYAT